MSPCTIRSEVDVLPRPVRSEEGAGTAGDSAWIRPARFYGYNCLMGSLPQLVERLRLYGGAVLALSGGMDSSLLAAAAQRAGIPLLAVTADSPLLPERERRRACEVALRLGIRHRLVEAGEWELPQVRENRADRCYHCKKARMHALLEISSREGLPLVMEGSQADDREEERPGLRAVEEAGARSPLRELGMGKREIAGALRELGLADLVRPSNSCLATRFPPDVRLNKEELRRVDRVEEWLEERGITGPRARWRGPRELRVEVRGEGLERLDSEPLRGEFAAFLQRAGFDGCWLEGRCLQVP